MQGLTKEQWIELLDLKLEELGRVMGLQVVTSKDEMLIGVEYLTYGRSINDTRYFLIEVSQNSVETYKLSAETEELFNWMLEVYARGARYYKERGNQQQ